MDVLEVFKRWWNTHHTRTVGSVAGVDTHGRHVAGIHFGHGVAVKTIWRVPVVVTSRPRQLTRKGGEQVVD